MGRGGSGRPPPRCGRPRRRGACQRIAVLVELGGRSLAARARVLVGRKSDGGGGVGNSLLFLRAQPSSIRHGAAGKTASCGPIGGRAMPEGSSSRSLGRSSVERATRPAGRRMCGPGRAFCASSPGSSPAEPCSKRPSRRARVARSRTSGDRPRGGIQRGGREAAAGRLVLPAHHSGPQGAPGGDGGGGRSLGPALGPWLELVRSTSTRR